MAFFMIALDALVVTAGAASEGPRPARRGDGMIGDWVRCGADAVMRRRPCLKCCSAACHVRCQPSNRRDSRYGPTARRLLSVMSRASEPRSSTALRRISAEFIAGHGF
jgi:hypothetical protein